MADIEKTWYELYSSKSPTKKSGYELRTQFIDKNRAFLWYQSLNIGLGYKKKLVEATQETEDKVHRKVLARAFS